MLGRLRKAVFGGWEFQASLVDPWEKVEFSPWDEMKLDLDNTPFIEYEAERDFFTGQIRIGKIIKKY